MLFVCFFFLLFCSVSGFWTEYVANLWSLIDEVGFRLGKGENQAFCLRRKKMFMTHTAHIVTVLPLGCVVLYCFKKTFPQMKGSNGGQKKYFFLLGSGPPDRHSEIETAQKSLPLPSHECIILSEDGFVNLKNAFRNLSKTDDVAVFILSHGRDSGVELYDGTFVTDEYLIARLSPLWEVNNFILVPCQCGAASLIEKFGANRCFAATTDISGSTWSGTAVGHDRERLSVNSPLIQFLSQNLKGSDNRKALCDKYRELLVETKALPKEEVHAAYEACAAVTGIPVEELEKGQLDKALLVETKVFPKEEVHAKTTIPVEELEKRQDKANLLPIIGVIVLIIVILIFGLYLSNRKRNKQK